MTENFNESKASFEGINDPTGYIPFEIIGNQFMAVGDEFSVKLYDINYNDIMINNPQQANKRREIQPLQTLKFDGKFNVSHSFISVCCSKFFSFVISIIIFNFF